MKYYFWRRDIDFIYSIGYRYHSYHQTNFKMLYKINRSPILMQTVTLSHGWNFRWSTITETDFGRWQCLFMWNKLALKSHELTKDEKHICHHLQSSNNHLSVCVNFHYQNIKVQCSVKSSLQNLCQGCLSIFSLLPVNNFPRAAVTDISVVYTGNVLISHPAVPFLCF